MAAITTSDLVVRSAPGTGAESEIQPVTLSEPAMAYVIDGPVVADGYEWYLVDPVRPNLLGDFPSAGWVAAAGKDGEMWIGPAETECRDDPTMSDLVNMAPQVRLYCYAGQTLTVDAVAEGCGMGILGPRDWPWGSGCLLFVPGQGQQSVPSGCVDVCVLSLRVWFNDLSLPADDVGIAVTGHFDDPDAHDCVDVNGEATVLAVHECRLEFVATDFSAP